MALSCSRCHAPLHEGAFRGVPLARCAACESVLVEIRHNVPFLEKLYADVADEIDLHDDIPDHHDQGGAVPCPRCSGTMERFGYMGTRKVMLDRCGRCMTLWIDGDELPTLARLYARTKKRGEERRAYHEQEARERARRVSRLLVARAMSEGMT